MELMGKSFASGRDDDFTIVVFQGEPLYGQVNGRVLFYRTVDLQGRVKMNFRSTVCSPKLFAALDAKFTPDFILRDTLVMQREYREGASGELLYSPVFGQCVYVSDVDLNDASVGY